MQFPPKFHRSPKHKDAAVLANRVFTLSTALLPYDNFEGLDENDDTYGNRFVFSSAHCAYGLLCVCIAAHFRTHWSEDVASQIWRVFEFRAHKEWVNRVRLGDIVISVDERLNLHTLINERMRKIGINEMLAYEDTMGSIFSLVLPTRSKRFKFSLQSIKERLEPKQTFGFGPENVLVFSSVLSQNLYDLAHTDGSAIRCRADAAKVRGLETLSSFLVGGIFAQAREFYKSA